MNSGSSSGKTLDIAIIGAGVSGCYCGWRLLTCGAAEWGAVQAALKIPKNGSRSVGLFEMSDSVGGRLLSVTPPRMPHVTCELGGMRFVSSQKLITSLVTELGLATDEMDFPVDEDENIAFFRGRYLRHKELTYSTKSPYDLRWTEQGYDPEALIAIAVQRIIPLVTQYQGEELEKKLRDVVIDGEPLYQWGFWNLIARSISHEAYDFSKDAVGYDCLGLNWNALDTTLEYYNFTPKVKYYRLRHGYQQVPDRLCQEFQAAAGQLITNYQLTSFHWADPDEKTLIQLNFDTPDGPDTWYARGVILAMPRQPLERLSFTSMVLSDPEVRLNLQTVTPIPLFKLCICYPYPWWESAGVRKGRSLTDLPIRQLYYWAVEGCVPEGDPHNQNAVAMVYDDQSNVDFWAGLRYQARTGIEAPELKAEAETEMEQKWHKYKAPPAMVQEVHRQMLLMHDLTYAPRPYAAAYRDWADEPFGGGVHLWNPGAKSWELIKTIAHPNQEIPLFICGEAYSTNQTWVEGALQTAEIVLEDLGLNSPPDWGRKSD